LADHKVRKLQLGCGRNILNSWLNSDLHKTEKEIIPINATDTLPFENATFNYIFPEHLVEHIEYYECIELLKECFRILKTDGKISIATPNMKFLIEL